MIGVQKNLTILLLSVSWAAAQNGAGTAFVQHVSAVPDGTDLRIEVTLNSSVSPSVETAVNPDRILIDLPETTCNACTQNVSVNSSGIRRVRTGQHSTRPMVTRIVVDLDQAHPYTMRTEGNRVILTVGPAENAHFQMHGAPVAATLGNLVAVFRRKRETAPPPVVDNNTAYVPPPTPPPAPQGPSFEPPSANASATPLPTPPPQVAPPALPPVAKNQPAVVATAAAPSGNVTTPKIEAPSAPVASTTAPGKPTEAAALSPKAPAPVVPPITAAAAPAPAATNAVAPKPKVEVTP